jgi:hypothetical protein
MPAGNTKPINDFAAQQSHAKEKHVQFEKEGGTSPLDLESAVGPINPPHSPHIPAGKLLKITLGGGEQIPTFPGAFKPCQRTLDYHRFILGDH